MRSGIPQVVKDAQRLRAGVEEAFVRMKRRHKYLSGADVRAAAKRVVVLALRAWRDRENRLALARELGHAVDELKLELQLAKDINAFGSFREFEAIARLAHEVGKQSGGWLRSLQPKGQNAEADQPPAQRAQTLSSPRAQAATP
jgi:hypothetical protein